MSTLSLQGIEREKCEVFKQIQRIIDRRSSIQCQQGPLLQLASLLAQCRPLCFRINRALSRHALPVSPRGTPIFGNCTPSPRPPQRSRPLKELFAWIVTQTATVSVQTIGYMIGTIEKEEGNRPGSTKNGFFSRDTLHANRRLIEALDELGMEL